MRLALATGNQGVLLVKRGAAVTMGTPQGTYPSIHKSGRGQSVVMGCTYDYGPSGCAGGKMGCFHDKGELWASLGRGRGKGMAELQWLRLHLIPGNPDQVHRANRSGAAGLLTEELGSRTLHIGHASSGRLSGVHAKAVEYWRKSHLLLGAPCTWL